MRHDPRGQQQLETKRKPVRGAGVGGVGADERKLHQQQPEHLWVGFLGLEQARHGIAGVCRGGQRARVVAQAGVGVDRVNARDRVELSPAFVQDHAHMEERLEPGPKATAGAAYALGDRA